MERGTNACLVVTSRRTGDPRRLYDWYVRRGESKNWTKDFKLALEDDRLSCHRFLANQFRLLLHAAAYWLLDTLRKRLVGAGTERIQLDTLSLYLVEIGGRVRAAEPGEAVSGPDIPVNGCGKPSARWLMNNAG